MLPTIFIDKDVKTNMERNTMERNTNTPKWIDSIRLLILSYFKKIFPFNYKPYFYKPYFYKPYVKNGLIYKMYQRTMQNKMHFNMYTKKYYTPFTKPFTKPFTNITKSHFFRDPLSIAY